jgi:hypothetical protein
MSRTDHRRGKSQSIELDASEIRLLETVERGEWRSVARLAERRARHADFATATRRRRQGR